MMRSRFVTTVLLLALVCVSTASGYGGAGLSRASMIPENSTVRASWHDVMVGPVGEAADRAARIERDLESGIEVRFEVISQEDALYFLFLNRSGREFPIAGSGNWVIKRSTLSGDFVQAKIFLQHAAGTFLRLFPEGAVTLMDVFLEGTRIHEGVLVRRSFSDLIGDSLERIIELTRYRVAWEVLLPQSRRPGDRLVSDMVDRLRFELPALTDSEDGAMDADGSYRLIEDLTENLDSGFNCSGFAKWVVDGLVYPLSGSYLSIERLKEKHLEVRGNQWSDKLEDARDPYFGLDWTRNLALALESVSGDPVDAPETADVRDVEFHHYVEDIGFRIDTLKSLFYLLAIERPGSVYLGSVNLPFGNEPVLRQHVHVAVFLPYFAADGTFEVVVMERNLETGLESLASRYPDAYVHLVELEVESGFSPPGLR